MNTKIFQNSYVIFVIAFIILYIIFYLLGIGATVQVVNGKPVKKTNWKYPLALALIIWVLWHFYLYPPPADTQMHGGDQHNPVVPNPVQINPTQKMFAQKIDMNNWN